MFQYCTSLESIDVSHFDTQNVRTMHTLFHACYKLKSVDLNFDTSNVTDMSYMFGHMREITYLNISKLNTEKVTNMESMFGNIFVLNELDISNFNVSNVENIDSLFVNSNIKKIYLDSWQLPKLTTYENLFTDGLFEEISIKNSNYNTINKFISQLPTMTNESKGTLTITGVDDLSKVNTAGANEKFWDVI
jgi:surface protein